MAKTLISSQILSSQIFQNFYLYYVDIVQSYHSIQLKGKLMNQLQKN